MRGNTKSDWGAALIMFWLPLATALAQTSPGRLTRPGDGTMPGRVTTLALFVVDQQSVLGGNPVQGTVTLSAAAPPGGAEVALTGDPALTPQLPATVRVAEGQLAATFPIPTAKVGTNASATITAGYGGVFRSLTVSVLRGSAGPTISALAISGITDNAASVSWTTSEPADTELEYGTTTSYGTRFRSADLFLNHFVNLSNLSAGTFYHVRVKATNADGAQTVSLDLTFTTAGVNQPPTLSVTASPVCGAAPLNVQFTASGRDPEGTALAYAWTFGDGSQATGAAVSHTYLASGNYTAKVVATDGGGATAEVRVVIAVSGATPPGAGAIFYVSPNGADSNPGTEAAPFKTIQHAADVVSPGDSVIVEDGVYTMGTPNTLCSTYTAVLCLTRGGTASNWVVFRARHKWGAKLDGQNHRVQNGVRFAAAGASYVRVEGFEIFGVGNDGSAAGFEVFNGASHLQMIGNNIHDVGKLCTDTQNGNVGIYIAESNVLIEGNVIHDIGRLGPGENGCAPATGFWQNHDHGIYHSRGDDVTIRNNIFYNMTHGWGIQVYPSNRARMLILNNTFSGPNPNRQGHIIIAGSGVTDSKIANNIFYQPNGAAMSISASSYSNLVVSNNLTTGSSLTDAAPPSGFLLANNLLSTDPLLANPAARDFHLQSSSPAIDAGLTLGEVTSDFDGCVRPQGRSADIGAYEFPGSPSLTQQRTGGPARLAAGAERAPLKP